jgi:preprotein translocase subunit SecY
MYRQSGQTHIPLRVNTVGMIPLIFAFSIIIFPAYVGSIFATSDNKFIADSADWIQGVFDPGSWGYWAFLFVTVVVFTFFYTLVVFGQQNLAENLQRQGGFVPGIRPGRPTEEYINRVLLRITWGGAFFLGFVAVAPFVRVRRRLQPGDVARLRYHLQRSHYRRRCRPRHDAPDRGPAPDAPVRRVHPVESGRWVCI